MMRPLLFATERYAQLAARLLATDYFEAGSIERQTFPDGEKYLRLATVVTGRSVIFLGGTVSDADTLELYDLACAAVKYGATTLTLAIPYFGYQTMERAIKPGEIVTAKTRARLFSAIPPASAGNRIVLLDLHAEGIPHYFEGDARPMHVYAKPVIKEAIAALAAASSTAWRGQPGPRAGKDEYVLACTDAGRAKWVESLANDLGVRAAFVFKRRLSGDQTEVTATSAQVEGCHVIIYDDMIRTGGSLIEAAKAYRAAGARKISAVTTHGVFPGEALQRLRASNQFDRVVCTDSHPRAVELLDEADDFLEVRSVSGLLAGVLRGEATVERVPA